MKKQLCIITSACILLATLPGNVLSADEITAPADMLITAEESEAEPINNSYSDTVTEEPLLIPTSEEPDVSSEADAFLDTDLVEGAASSDETESLSEGAFNEMIVETDETENLQLPDDGILSAAEEEVLELENYVTVSEDSEDETLYAAGDDVFVNAESVTLYYLSGYYPDHISSIPEDIPTSFQIEVSGTDKKPVFESSGGYTKVDENGLITLSDGHGSRNTPGEVRIKIDGRTVARITVDLACYEQYIAEQKVNADIERLGINNLDNDYDKVKAICEYISTTYSYSAKTSSMTGEVITGGADCWGNSDLVWYMCDQCNIPAYTRDASFEYAGSSHENNIVKIGEYYYIVDCGFTGNAPRHYDFYKAHSDFDYSWNSDGTICLVSSMRFDSDVITIPAQIDGHKVSSIRTGMLQQREYSKIYVEEGSDYFSSKNGALYTADGKKLIACPRKTAGSYMIADGVETIGEYAFKYCEEITQLIMPDSLTTIEEDAFSWCSSLSEIRWSTSLVSIGENAFSACGSLRNIILPESLRTIGAGAFCASMQPLYVYIPSGVTSIGAGAFLNVPFMAVRAKNPELGYLAISQCTIFCYPGSTVDTTCNGEHFDINLLDGNNRLVLQKDFFIVDQTDRTYNGYEQTPSVKNTEDYRFLRVYDWTWSEEEERSIYGIIRDNYDITYQNNINAGTATILISGKNWCSGTLSYTFKINPKALFSSDYYGCQMRFKETGYRSATYEYTGQEIRPQIDIYSYGEITTAYQNGIDYTLSYSDNILIGKNTGTITLNGIGNYSGSDTLHFTIKGQLPDPEPIADQQYDGSLVRPEVVIPGLTQDVDYYINYWDNDRPGRAYVTASGLGCYEGDKTVYFNIIGKLPQIYYAIADQEYTGSEIKPHVYIPGAQEDVDYVLSYSNNIDPGIATVTATGTGYYTGVQTATFTIKAANTGSSSGTGSGTDPSTGSGTTPSYHGSWQDEDDEDDDDESYETFDPTIRLSAYSIPLKVGQSTNKVKVSGLMKGDSVWFWTSSNTKVASVNQKGVIKAGKKTGTAYVTVWTEFGAYATVKVTVQKKKVAAKKISVVKSVKLKRGQKYSLNAVAAPVTATDKIKYKSSKKKVATVSKNGVIKAKKKGKTVITVSCGKKKVKVRVIVK